MYTEGSNTSYFIQLISIQLQAVLQGLEGVDRQHALINFTADLWQDLDEEQTAAYRKLGHMFKKSVAQFPIPLDLGSTQITKDILTVLTYNPN